MGKRNVPFCMDTYFFLKYFMVKYNWQGRDRHKVQEENMVQRISIKGLFGCFDYGI